MGDSACSPYTCHIVSVTGSFAFSFDRSDRHAVQTAVSTTASNTDITLFIFIRPSLQDRSAGKILGHSADFPPESGIQGGDKRGQMRKMGAGGVLP